MKNYRAPQKYQPSSFLAKRLAPAFIGLTLLGASVASATEVTFRYYRFTPTKNYQDSDTTSTTNVQLSEFTFALHGTLLNVNNTTGVGAVVPVTASGGTNDAAADEGAAKVVDGSLDTKWYNGTRSLPLVFDFSTPTTIDGYNFATANDSLNRTPVSWTLEGSADGTTWVAVDTRADVAPTAELKYYQSGFIIGGGTVLPGITFGTTTTVGTDSVSVAAPGIVKNGTPTSLTWAVTNSTGVALLSPTSATVAATATQSVTAPSDVDTSYTLNATNASGTDGFTQNVRSVAGGTATYSYYRFQITGRRGGPGDNRVQLSEFEFYNGTTKRQILSVENPGGTNGNGETPEMLFDGSTATKWLDFNNKPLVFSLATDTNNNPLAIDSYQFFTANDSPDRDPVRWTLEGSNDLDSWTLVDAIDTIDYPATTARLTGSGKLPITGTSLRWAGTTSGTWDTTVANFKKISGTTAATFRKGVPVTFDDSATQTTVTLPAAVEPGWLGFKNSTKNYTISGSAIAGQTRLVKGGIGSVNLAAANTFTGDIAINGGTLTASAVGALGPRTQQRAITLTSSSPDVATLQVNANLAAQGPLAVTGDFDATGAVNVGDSFTFNHYGPLQLTRTLVKNGKGTLHFEAYRAGSSSTATTGLIVNAGLVEFGSSYFNSQPLGSRTFVATVNTGGVLRLAADDVLGGDYVDLQTSIGQLQIVGGTLRVNGNEYVPTPLVNGEGAIVLDGGTIDGGFALNSSSSSTGRSTISTRANSVSSQAQNVIFNTTPAVAFHPGSQFVFDVADGAAADDLVLSGNGKITGAFGFVKQGDGNMVLAQASDYVGTPTTDTFAQPDGTTVTAGTLTVTNTTGSATGMGTVLVNAGAKLAGTGFITGASTIAGNLAPGKEGIGTLTLGKTTLTGSLVWEVNGATADQVVVNGDLNLTGSTLVISQVAAPTAATYVIASFTGTLTGSFGTVTGLPTGYAVVYDAAAKTISLKSGATQTGYDAWVSAPGLTGANAATSADPDGDGIKNGIEFVLGGNPKTADTSILPTAVRDGSGNLVFTFRRAAAAAYLNPGVQYSTDLSTWTAAPAGDVVVTANGFASGVDKVVVTLPATLAAGNKLFTRLVDTTNAP
jgi:autotransporter-associated beta strand protein